MNVMLQRHAAKYIYVIPEGLKELMSDISREVLRSQPQNLYIFIADYLEALLLTRENARVAARLVQSITEIAEATMEFLEETGMEKHEADKVVNIIHETFKKRIRDDFITIPYEPQAEDIEEANIITDIIHEAEIGADLAEEAAKIIQNAYKKFKNRKEAEKQLLSGMIDWRVAARSAIKLYRQTGVTTEEANRAATLIKAAYKGYYTRRVMKKLTDEPKLLHSDIESMDRERQQEDEEGKEGLDYRRPGSQTVRIDYDTVIPHVDFGDATEVEGKPAVVAYALEKIIDNVMKKVEHAKKGQKHGKKAGKKPPPKSRKPAKSKKPAEPVEQPQEEIFEYETPRDEEEGDEYSISEGEQSEQLDLQSINLSEEESRYSDTTQRSEEEFSEYSAAPEGSIAPEADATKSMATTIGDGEALENTGEGTEGAKN